MFLTMWHQHNLLPMRHRQAPLLRPKRVKKRGKQAKEEEEIMRNVEHQLGRIANAIEEEKSQFISKQSLDEIMTLSDHYAEYNLG